MRNSKPYLIAEIGVNFYDTARVMGITPLEAAKLYIDKVAEAGIDCAKFQSYKAGTIVSNSGILGYHEGAYEDSGMSFS